MVIVVMGVSGSGKSTVGRLLAQRLGLPFFDADDYHSPESIARMSTGTPLEDTDRQPWLALLAGNIAVWDRGKGAVLACSALKETYRRILRGDGTDVRFVYLKGSPELIESRMRHRNHYMQPAMLASQFATLEEPHDAIVADIAKAPEDLAEEVAAQVVKS